MATLQTSAAVSIAATGTAAQRQEGAIECDGCRFRAAGCAADPEYSVRVAAASAHARSASVNAMATFTQPVVLSIAVRNAVRQSSSG